MYMVESLIPKLNLTIYDGRGFVKLDKSMVYSDVILNTMADGW